LSEARRRLLGSCADGSDSREQQKASEAFQKFKQLEERENPSKKID